MILGNITWRNTIAAGVLVVAAATVGRADDLRIAQDDATVSVFDGGRPVLRYRYSGVPKKPYVDQLFSPGGVQILRDSPHDHKHHHGLMFALSVGGVGFWEEGASSGTQRHLDIGDVKSEIRDGCGRAGFVERLEWTVATDKSPPLGERREIRVLKLPNLGATLVEWRCLLEAGWKPSVVLSGSHYYGLGMRFVESMDRGGHFFFSDDKPSEKVRGTEKLTPARWCAYTAKADGRPVTVALFDHPKNLRHPARMFTMSEPFAYFSATFNVWKEPIMLTKGEPLQLIYGIALWDGKVAKETIEKVYQHFVEIQNHAT